MKTGACRVVLNGRSLLVISMMVVAVGVRMARSETNGQSGINDAPVKTASVKRDPFWPVGYVPEEIKNMAEKKDQLEQDNSSENQKWSRAMQQVVINGVSSRNDKETFAVINGQVKSVGDTISVNYLSATYTWAVESVTPPSSVKLRRVSVQ